jgi:hypothetical protein
MILDLVGVCEDGSAPRGVNVPHNPRKSLSIVQGESVLLRFQALRANGEPFPTVGWAFVWSFKKKRNGVQMRREGSPIVTAGVGRVDFVLSAAETTALKPGQYAYDVFAYVPGGAQEALVPYSDLHIEPALYPTLSGAITPSPGLPLNPATHQRVYGAAMAGATNGTNASFLAPAKFALNKEAVFVNGVLMRRGAGNDYTLSESGGAGTGYDTVVLVYVLRTLDVILLDYDPA